MAGSRLRRQDVVAFDRERRGSPLVGVDVEAGLGDGLLDSEVVATGRVVADSRFGRVRAGPCFELEIAGLTRRRAGNGRQVIALEKPNQQVRAPPARKIGDLQRYLGRRGGRRGPARFYERGHGKQIRGRDHARHAQQ